MHSHASLPLPWRSGHPAGPAHASERLGRKFPHPGSVWTQLLVPCCRIHWGSGTVTRGVPSGTQSPTFFSGPPREPRARPEQCPHPERARPEEEAACPSGTPNVAGAGAERFPPARTRRVVWLHLKQTASAGRRLPGLPRAWYRLHRPQVQRLLRLQPQSPGKHPNPRKGRIRREGDRTFTRG